MNKSLTTKRDEKKKDLIQIAEKLIEKINKSGLKHGHIAKEIKVGDETFSRFMALKEDYVTQRICDALTEFFKDK